MSDKKSYINILEQKEIIKKTILQLEEEDGWYVYKCKYTNCKNNKCKKNVFLFSI